ncbi:MAG: DUF1700 domain-containing protein [Oscillospiraceae bacterium]|jgi:uncharacterized membrane protein|nr:DUF1700 domain-containing protein [Oscillospiraceae bacterium]
MNRNEFIAELKKKLRKLPFDEIKEAVDYYEGYFDDAGIENEQVAFEELGSPSTIASQIIANFAVNKVDTEKSGKKSLHLVWLVILALFAAPIAVPIVLSVGIVVIALIFSLFSILFSFFIAGVAFIGGGILSIVAGFLVITQSIPTTIFYVGIGLASLGIGMAIVIVIVKLSQICFNWLVKKIGNFILRRKQK